MTIIAGLTNDFDIVVLVAVSVVLVDVAAVIPLRRFTFWAVANDAPPPPPPFLVAEMRRTFELRFASLVV